MSRSAEYLITHQLSEDGKNMRWGIETAIEALRPGAKYALSGGKETFLGWRCPNNSEPPTWEEVLVEYERQKSIAEYYQYIFDRTNEYPDGYKQLELLWDAVDQEIDLKESEWYKQIKKIKQKYPKPRTEAPE
jgi:hypothetical protein